MKRRTRDRRGRFLKGGRKSGRRRSSSSPRRKKRTSGRRRRSSSRTSNPPPRRRRRRSSSSSRRPRVRTRTRVVTRARYRNPPYGVKEVLLALGVTAVGFAGAWTAPLAVSKLLKKPELNFGWKSVGVSFGATVVMAGIGYGIGRALGTKRLANMVAGELAVGGLLATGFQAVQVYRAPAPAPRVAPPMGSLVAPGASVSSLRGMGLITDQDLARAQNAARMLGMGYLISPQAADNAPVSQGFGRESTF